MLKCIEKQVEQEGHVIVYLSLEKKEYVRLAELLTREHIYNKRIIDNFLLFYPEHMSDSSVNRIVVRTIQSLKQLMPELFDDDVEE